MKIAFRPAVTEADRRFVIASWLDASRTSYSSGLIAMADWYDVMWPQYAKVLDRPGMRSLVAYEATDPDFAYGFLVADPSEQRVPERDGSVRWWPALVMFCFVKQGYRRSGIARRLFAEMDINLDEPFLYGCNTQTASRLSAKAPKARFNPLVARFDKEAA